MATTNQPLNFIPGVPIYTNGVMSEAWRIFFNTIWTRTGGNTNVINNITEYVLSSGDGATAAQQIDNLRLRIQMLESDNATSLAIQALEMVQATGSGLTAGQVMAYSTLGIV